MTLKDFERCFSLATWNKNNIFQVGKEWIIEGSHVNGEGINGGEESSLSHGRYDPDDERQCEEGISLVYPLKESKTDVADARDQCAEKE